MIPISEVLDLLGGSFANTYDTFKWADNALIRGTLRNLPTPQRVKDLYNEKYFAVYMVDSVLPSDDTSDIVTNPVYQFSIILCHRGSTGDISKLREDMIEKFSAGFEEFWLDHDQWTMKYMQILPHVDEIEESLDCIAVGFMGTLTHVTERGDRLYG